ncbi:Lrp/AsnC family transcriptional regulator [Pseudomonas veronii]|uniref:Lrp/AsnC family transcriptional regulator n=1 Tax=Pseudomonas veronii TaxID=76761 RepID=UPI0021C0476B|nr:Lrp/AsnC family transcriptional regulator [Pseudomonas veronii]MCT8962814.1 Lrp/AsnC family transcriptional regulator [Pseudomonas veronii]
MTDRDSCPLSRVAPDLDEADRRLINKLQDGFPLCPRPFAEAAAQLDMSEEELIERVARLRAAGILTRFGPLFQIERAGGAYCLAAMAVSEARWETVLEYVNARIEVAHNYRREHALNMWFVLATARPVEIAACIDAIQQATGLAVLAFPKEREYFLEMKLEF